jgi:hypothetical protein
MPSHKKIACPTGYSLVVVTPNPTDANVMQDLE